MHDSMTCARITILICGFHQVATQLIHVDIPQVSNETTPSQCIQNIQESENLNLLTIFARFVTPVLFGVFFLVGTVGNILVITVILANAQMRNTTNILIFSLAMADLALLLVCVPSATATYIAGSWPLGDIICRLYYFSAYVSFYCSAYTLLLMSLDRFLAVVYPIECVTFRNARNCVRAVTCIWTVVMLANITLLINSGLVSGPANGQDVQCLTEYCTYKWLVTEVKDEGYYVDNIPNSRLYFILFFLFGYLIPFIIISSLYMTVIVRLRCRKSAHVKQSAESLKSKKRATKLVVVVVSVFGVCMLPLYTVFICQYYVQNTDSTLFRIIQILSNCLAYGNSCFNPVLYAFISPHFRRAFNDLFRGRRSANLNVNTCVPLPNDTVTELSPQTRILRNSSALLATNPPSRRTSAREVTTADLEQNGCLL